MTTKRLSLTTRDEVEAVASPVRMEIIRHLQSHGRCTVGELASLMRRSADSLYYHVRRLAEAGVLERVGSRPAGRREEAVLALSADGLTFAVEEAAGAGAEAAIRTTRDILREAEHNLRRAVERDPAGAHAKDMPVVARLRSRLDEAGRAEVRAHLDAISEIFIARKGDAAGTLHELTMLLVPLDEAGPGADRRARPTC
ncbi:MAG TPA: helix-turn-helix domain-containing protein [Planctomycetota bacterium]|nr:helix-turn-helix domain-containing protein [Planctomycetota bacterium]